MNILLVGSGGREHALAWKLLQSDLLTRLDWVMGSEASIQILSAQYPNKKIERVFFEKKEPLMNLVQIAKKRSIDLAVIGPDQYLADGLTDLLLRAQIQVFGPTQAASQLEWSKSFAKEMMIKAKVPTADFFICNTPSESEEQLRSLNWANQQWVLKSDGLALGKGVEVCKTLDQALSALERLKLFSPKLVIEERLYGEEISWLAFCDGETCALLDPARDYKTLTENQTGPNTGGMGSISPVLGIDSNLREKVRSEVFESMIQVMRTHGIPFKGVLYAGLMVSESRYSVLEFNARFGDPETQALLPRMTGDLIPWLLASAQGKLSGLPKDVPFQENHACYVVTSTPGYPHAPETGAEVLGLENWTRSADVYGFLSGISVQQQTQENHFVTSGGRVLGTLGLGETPEKARQTSYRHLESIRFPKMHWRKDIGL